ncbi:aminotransferase class V-fold PLP-dependent enzyme [Nocardioides sp. GY 10127]|uniref:aminotransferase class I/II-fold pyridoxal phosphate-dependent enzyme n=1 Tax=Nocardioides sp. GY 10127 TaxID=2569762 RepID=UPI0010A7929C|nr:aminotransferase class V-fold PLP-dependent enzyme [Nocardioides sp. GY 10127]TIC79273.1 aminotransferase class V-fold PLP-dependent enzyme [Nocardioides sp. GY 10127]
MTDAGRPHAEEPRDLDAWLLERAPLLRAWADFTAAAPTPFTIPGHQRRAGAWSPTLGAVLAADVPLYGGLDTVGLERGTLARAEALAAARWGADVARYSTGGATHANQALLLATTGPGDTVLVARNAHRSTLLGLVQSGARPVWLPLEHDEASGLPLGVAPATLEAALAEHARSAAVVLVEPSYLGTLHPQRRRTIEVAHAAGAAVLVDQAWAAYLGFHPDYPAHALALGADALVTSAHKALPAFSQAALVVARTERIDPARLDQAFEAGHTTSPAGAILASADAATALLEHPRTRAALGDLAALLASARARLRAVGYVVPGPDTLPAADPAKLVVTGSDRVPDLRVLAEALAARGMPLEMADAGMLVPIVGLIDPAPAVEALVRVAEEVAAGSSLSRPVAPLSAGAGWASSSTFPPQRLTPREAFFAARETVGADEAVGRVCAEVVAPYPPGVPVLVPGEEVTVDTLATLRRAQARGVRIAYAADASLATLQVVR